MQAIEALSQRTSTGRLQAPAPTEQQCRTLIECATRAADHGLLRPWRFLVVEGEGLDALGELYCRAGLEDNPELPQAKQDKFRKMPRRAPMVMVVIARCQAHPKVPEREQIISAGAAAQNIINAAFAMGLGAMWRTGDMAYHPTVESGLGLQEGEHIVGYLYLGTRPGDASPPKALNIEDFFQTWP